MHHIQAVFIDRDGTIGGSDKVEYPGEFQLYPGANESINLLKKSVDYIFSFTNQPGIARGEATIEAFEKELTGFGFNKMYLCPHEPKEKCHCRKPDIGMLQKAAQEHHLTLKNCIVIGDRWTDMLAAQTAGCRKILIKTGAGQHAINKYLNQEEWGKVAPDYVATDFNDAVNWIIKGETHER